MNEVFKKLLKELGVDDATLEKIFAENVEEATVEALFPDVSKLNRTKWEGVLGMDSKWTEQFSARGHAAGQAIAYQKVKDGILRDLGLQIDPTTDEYKDNAKFAAKLKAEFAAAKGKTTEGGEGKQKEELARLQAEFDKKLAETLTAERETLSGQHAAQMKSLKQDFGFESELLGYGMDKKMKGGLPLNVLLPAIKAQTAAYKWEFDDNGKLVKVLGADGFEMDNEKRDGKLSPKDVLATIYKPFIDDAPSDTGGQQQRQGDGTPNGKTTLSGTMAEMDSFRN